MSDPTPPSSSDCRKRIKAETFIACCCRPVAICGKDKSKTSLCREEALTSRAHWMWAGTSSGVTYQPRIHKFLTIRYLTGLTSQTVTFPVSQRTACRQISGWPYTSKPSSIQPGLFWDFAWPLLQPLMPLIQDVNNATLQTIPTSVLAPASEPEMKTLCLVHSK